MTTLTETVTFDTLAPASGEVASGIAAMPAHSLLLKQKRSLGRYGVGLHIHRRFEQLIICERGAGSITFADGRHVFNAPVILVVPSVTAHGLSFDESSERWVVSVASEYLQHLASRAPEFSELFTRVRCIQCSPHEREYVELRHVLDKLDWEQQRSASCREIVTEALLIDVLVSVLRQLQDGKEAAPEEGATDEHVYEQFSDLVDEHFREHWSLQRFADALDVTVSRLRAACSNVGGQSPIRVINARILLEAKRCLAHTDLTVSEIACRLGFEDASYFSRFFKSRCGQTPTLYKANKADLRARDQQVREKAETPSGMDALKVD